MSVAIRAVVLVLGIVMFGLGVRMWWVEGVMTLWPSVLITTGFSFLVVGLDEWMHALRHQRQAREGRATLAH
jgi:hypothetical protein